MQAQRPPVDPWREGVVVELLHRIVLSSWIRLHESVGGGSVNQLLDVTVERPALEQLQVEIGRIPKDRRPPGLTGDDREERYLHAVDQADGHQRPVHRQAAV